MGYVLDVSSVLEGKKLAIGIQRKQNSLNGETNLSLRPYSLKCLLFTKKFKVLKYNFEKKQVSDKMLIKEIATDDDTLCSTSWWIYGQAVELKMANWNSI